MLWMETSYRPKEEEIPLSYGFPLCWSRDFLNHFKGLPCDAGVGASTGCCSLEQGPVSPSLVSLKNYKESMKEKCETLKPDGS